MKFERTQVLLVFRESLSPILASRCRGRICIAWHRDVSAGSGLIISKALAKWLLNEVVVFATILNLQGAAPMENQVREIISQVLLRQVLVPGIIATGNIQ